MPKFQKRIAKYSAAEIVQAIGCKRNTAYSWLDGSRTPPYLQDEIVRLLREKRREARKGK
jgi:hypothetical protein